MRSTTLMTAAIVMLISAVATSAGNKTVNKAEDHSAGKVKNMTTDYLAMPLKTIDGHDTTLAAFKGKVTLVVNVASKCGYTPQYEGLEKLYEKYQKQGFVVVGFPANNFGEQEPGTNKEIMEFCSSKFSVKFPMMAKVSVKGDDINPLFAWLTEKSPIPGEIKWNFSKFLLDKNGTLIARFPSKIEPLDSQVTEKIEAALK